MIWLNPVSFILTYTNTWEISLFIYWFSFECITQLAAKGEAALGVLGFPSLKTALGMYFIEKEAEINNTDSNPLPISVKLYSILIGYWDTISLLMIPSCSCSRRRSVRTFGVIPSIFSINRLNCAWPLRISLMIKTVRCSKTDDANVDDLSNIQTEHMEW